MVNIGNDWDALLASDFESENYRNLRKFLKYEYQNATVYPDMYHIFEALKLTPPQNVKVVILGQDPYHGPGQAHGLCFSVQDGTPFPPSLQNIFKELQNEFGYDIPQSGNLSAWGKEGVLLLNTTLTVRAASPMSHAGKGWEEITDAVIKAVAAQNRPVVYMLWGSHARSKKALIHNPLHLVLESVHPSPLSAYRGFFGCGHFAKANDYLRSRGIAPVNWQLE